MSSTNNIYNVFVVPKRKYLFVAFMEVTQL